MYEIYKTKAIVISKKNFLEKSKKIVLFTEKFGFIYVVAHGISDERSKNKHILQIGNFADVYLVIGKNKWILTGGEVIENIYYSSGYSMAKSLYFVLSILRKNIIFNVKETEIFNEVVKMYFNKSDLKKNTLKKSKKMELNDHVLRVKKILKMLGYWNSEFYKNERDVDDMKKISLILKSI